MIFLSIEIRQAMQVFLEGKLYHYTRETQEETIGDVI
jgi:hypothetical protein